MNKFARNKSLNKNVIKKVHELQDLRHAADYSDVEPSQTDLKKALSQARDIFSMTERYLLELYGEIME